MPVVHGLTVHRADEDTGAAGLTRSLKDATLSLGDDTGFWFGCERGRSTPIFAAT